MDGFNWDRANETKNWVRHKVGAKECEQIFFNEPKIVYKDIKHSFVEERFGILGKTDNGRLLHVTFIVRENKIRVISARDQNKKERKRYESKRKNS